MAYMGGTARVGIRLVVLYAFYMKSAHSGARVRRPVKMVVLRGWACFVLASACKGLRASFSQNARCLGDPAQR